MNYPVVHPYVTAQDRRRRSHDWLWLVLLLLLLLLLCGGAAYVLWWPRPDRVVVNFGSGPVEVSRVGGKFKPVEEFEQLKPGDVIRTGPGGYATIDLGQRGYLEVFPESELVIAQVQLDQAGQLNVKVEDKQGVVVGHTQPQEGGEDICIGIDVNGAEAVIEGDPGQENQVWGEKGDDQGRIGCPDQCQVIPRGEPPCDCGGKVVGVDDDGRVEDKEELGKEEGPAEIPSVAEVQCGTEPDGNYSACVDYCACLDMEPAESFTGECVCKPRVPELCRFVDACAKQGLVARCNGGVCVCTGAVACEDTACDNDTFCLMGCAGKGDRAHMDIVVQYTCQAPDDCGNGQLDPGEQCDRSQPCPEGFCQACRCTDAPVPVVAEVDWASVPEAKPVEPVVGVPAAYQALKLDAAAWLCWDRGAGDGGKVQGSLERTDSYSTWCLDDQGFIQNGSWEHYDCARDICPYSQRPGDCTVVCSVGEDESCGDGVVDPSIGETCDLDYPCPEGQWCFGCKCVEKPPEPECYGPFWPVVASFDDQTEYWDWPSFDDLTEDWDGELSRGPSVLCGGDPTHGCEPSESDNRCVDGKLECMPVEFCQRCPRDKWTLCGDNKCDTEDCKEPLWCYADCAECTEECGDGVCERYYCKEHLWCPGDCPQQLRPLAPEGTSTPTGTPTPISTLWPTATPTPTGTPQPTVTPTPTPTRQRVCNPGQWTGCGGLPPDWACNPTWVRQCTGDGTWGPCQWDPTGCGEVQPPQPSEPCECGNGVCESNTPCYESSGSCPDDCGEPPPPSCHSGLGYDECIASGGKWVHGLTSDFCLCPSTKPEMPI